jgi:nitrate reductase gamma subunit
MTRTQRPDIANAGGTILTPALHAKGRPMDCLGRWRSFAITAVAFLLLGLGPPAALCGTEGNPRVKDKEGADTLVVPARNLLIAETAPRPFHRKGEGLVRATGKDCVACHGSAGYPRGDFFGWENRHKWTLHWWMFSLSMMIMLPGIYSTVLLWRMGRSPSLHHPVHWPSVVRALAREAVLGERVRRQSGLRWSVFLLISMAFLALAVVFGLIVVHRFVLPLLGVTADRAGLVLDFGADLLGGCILAGTLLAGYRRLLGIGGRFKTEAEDLAVLLLLFGIVTTGFFLEACRLAVVDPQPRLWASFLGAAGASLLRPWDLPWTGIRFYVWLLHAALVFGLFAYFPFSKLFHIVASPVSIAATASEAHYKQRQ